MFTCVDIKSNYLFRLLRDNIIEGRGNVMLSKRTFVSLE